ncbi:LacI family DNA-binding transcriptional regulator [Lederbergia ruris]|uniref:LacI family DNA-binding transcriptional regulator n=1 Tax=Lederbergia ruris TaxID=217495 RepID=UPI00399FA8AA
MKVTAKMIAEELGISTATVDRVLNNRKGVSEKTIRRVKAKAKEMGYRPNTAAKFLATQKRTEVAFILPVFPEYFWDEIEAEIKSAAELYKDFGFVAHIQRVHAIPNKNLLDYFKKIIKNNPYDALVIAPHDSTPFIDVINEGINKGIPIFTINNDVPESKRIFYVGGDYYSAGYLAAEIIYLFSKKLKDVVIIRDEDNTFQMTNKEKGFREYFHKNRINVNIHTVCTNGWDSQLGGDKIIRTLSSTDAIYVASGILGEVAEYIDEHIHGGDRIVVGHDMSKEIYFYLQKNIINSIICQDPASQAFLTVKNVFEYLVLGERHINSETIIKLEIVTKANAKYYINFEKPPKK